MMKKIGKIGKVNQKVNKRLKQMYEEIGIRDCEINLSGCDNWFLQFVHRHKRNWYKEQTGSLEELEDALSSYYQTCLGCNHCHQIIEKDAKLTSEVFARIRGEE